MREMTLDLAALYPGLKTSGRYDYAILVDEMNVGRFACESYGVSVTARTSGERATVPNITVNIPRIDALVELLVRNEVGPTHLRDVVEDWL